jgi:uncharacterized protein YggT (Ycf19 family)
MIRPVLVFLLVLLFVAPVIAIAGVVAWNNWAPAGLMVAGALVFWAGRRALVPIREYAPTLGGIQMRMKAIVWLVASLGAVLSAASAFWLGWRLIS